MNKRTQIFVYRLFPVLACLFLFINLSAQSFLTEDYPEYAYRVKLQSQHAFFSEDNYPGEIAGVYNLSAALPLNHLSAIRFNVPMVVNYNIPDKNSLEAGNLEIAFQFRTLNKVERRSQYSLGILLPLQQRTNPHFFGLHRYKYEEWDIILPDRSPLTDFPHCGSYIPGYGGSIFSYALHFKQNNFIFMVRAKATLMCYLDDNNLDLGPFFINSEFKGGYRVGKFSLITELLNTYFFMIDRYFDDDYFPDKIFWTLAAGLTFDHNWFNVGTFYQMNMTKEINEFAPHVIGVQVMISIDKKEMYLRSKND